MNEIITTLYHSPCGSLLLGDHQAQLCLCDWQHALHGERSRRHAEHWLCATMHAGHSALLSETARQLDAYFEGKLFDFQLPMLMQGTPFQMRVWENLLHLPYATTCTYAELADSTGHAQSVRAVANAIGANPLSIIVPCHRVVASGGRMGGYAGGTEAKRFLIDMEHDYAYQD